MIPESSFSMVRSLISSRSLARAVIALMFFSAISPAIAATLLSHRPAALAKLLGIPPAKDVAVAGHAAHEHDAHHSGPKTDDGAPHEDHGVFCSFCLSASSTLALADAAVSAFILLQVSQVIAIERLSALKTALLLPYHSRAPPVVS